jgi:hemerythrin superfamily protein
MTSKKKSRDAGESSSATPDAIKLLKADHAEVKEMFEQFESARSSAQKSKLAATICQALTAHTTIEEEIFYPAAREALEEGDLIDEAEVEHQSAKVLIAEIEAGGPDDDLWDAKVKVLGEYINHHVKEEEEEMFPAVRKTDLDLKALGEEMAARKEELMAEEPA